MIIGFIFEVLTSALVASALLGVVGWLARSLINERLKSSVSHEFGAKLETLKAEFRVREARMQAQLQGSNQQLQLLQNGILSARASRQAALDSRRLEAIDTLWAAFHELAQFRAAAMFLQTIKYEPALAQAAIDPNVRDLFKQMAQIAGVNTSQLKAQEISPWKAKLYVTNQAWKLFEIYRGVLYVQVLRLKQLESGAPKDFTRIKETVAEVKRVLPHQASFLDEHGDDVLSMLVDELGLAFEKELVSLLQDEPRSAEDLRQAGEIMTAAEKLIGANASEK